jgi:uroporphyrinogen-III synthase
MNTAMPNPTGDPRHGLAGVRVALLEARMGAEMRELLDRYGAATRVVAAVREAPIDSAAAVSALLDRLEGSPGQIVVFLTGVGATSLFTEADRQGRLDALLHSLRRATIICRGPKPTAVVKRYGLAVPLPVPQPYTSDELLAVLEPLQLEHAAVTLVHYGERNARLAEAIARRGATLHDICVYEWRLPDDLRPLETLVRDILAGQFDAVIFTSQIQGRHVLRVADAMQLRDPLVRALNEHVVVAAMGPVCKAALEELGVAPQVVPVVPKMGPLVSSLAAHFSAQTRHSDSK